MNLVEYRYVKINNGFWKEKQDMVKNTTVHAVYERFKQTHRFEALKCNWQEGDPHVPHVYWDSDVAKWLEGAAYILAFERNEQLEELVDSAVNDIVQNTGQDGYFNSHFLVTEKDKRFTDRGCHELYCAGHLMEAAVAYYQATGKDAFLKAMCRYADYIEQIFKIEDSASFKTPGHPELELALMRLYEATGEQRYADLAKFFIDEHGNNKKDKEVESWTTKIYNMDDMPLREVKEPAGHAVRALYLLCGMADVANEYGDKALEESCKRCYASIVNKRMYITGGVGSTSMGEAFTVDYHLPNRTAYAETCASISLAMFCLRMLKLENDAKYADTVERVIFNGVLSGVSMSGKEFFYENPLEIDLDFNDINPATVTKERYPITERPEMFSCSCCPPNIIRFITSIGGYIYGYDDDTIYINQFIDSQLQMDGTEIVLTTNYPADNKVHIQSSTDKKRLAVRIPEWCQNIKTDQEYIVKDGYMIFDTVANHEVTLEFDMPVTALQSNRRVHDNAGRIAISRGPIIYCAEGVDNGEDLNTVYLGLDEEYQLGESEFLLPNILTTAYVEEKSESLYYRANTQKEKRKLKLIPYYAFANQGSSSMQVWFLKN